MRKLRILDLEAGYGGERRREMIESRGHIYVTLDIDPKFNCTITKDIFEIDPRELGDFDFIWASPPCQGFSVASIGHHWKIVNGEHIPQTEFAKYSIELVKKNLQIIENINPSLGWLMENPRGKLRQLDIVKDIPRVTITYCQYGENRMKATDIWGYLPGWEPRPMCKNGDKCHESAPRGSRKGTQGIKGSAERAVVPEQLWIDILDIMENS